MASSLSSKEPPKEEETPPPKVIRLLALHGSEGNAANFQERLEPWKIAATAAHWDLQITTVTAPVPKGRGYAWWSMPPNVRSYNATEYPHFEKSSQLVLETLETDEYDYVVGFSQGAILITSLLALQRLPTTDNQNQKKPLLGCILMGGAWPNPYTNELESLANDATTNPCRVLIVTGQHDAINPYPQSERVQSALQKGGHDVTLLPFDGGHVVPTVQYHPETVQDILTWMQEGRQE
eukprot:CAMPEP_0172443444 /NCGR_PEP_ID=MMETSP1065-20121228/3707_1 /TAXON_ID=265537 /ORGANISM="Amphiprora paludosa, Strain CCMP125" /LENGTH=236 /DNA_ID=CAMNT_0013193683 /DNA_START=178 /DNA_END=888 /DNA_ORIENTATION=+